MNATASVQYRFELRTRAPGADWRVIAVFYSLFGAQAFARNTERDAGADWRIVVAPRD